MSRYSITVLTKNNRLITPAFLKQLEALGTVSWVQDAREKSPSELAALLAATDIGVTGWGTPLLPADFPAKNKHLKYLCHLTGEMKRIIPPEYLESGVRVTNWGESMAFATAEGALALLLCILRDIPGLDRTARTTGRSEFPAGLCVHSLLRARVGIYGLSSVGIKTAELLRPFSPHLSFYDPTIKEVPADMTRYSTLDDLFRNNDIITIHAGLNPATRGSVTAKQLALLNPGAILLNTARGPIVDEKALAKALHEKRLYAGIDVIDSEEDWRTSPLIDAPNTILTGHVISRTGAAGMAVRHETTLDNIKAFIEGRPLKYEISLERYRLMT